MDTRQKTQTLQDVVEDGVKHGASIIHLEPSEQGGLVKYRIGNWLGMAQQLQESQLEKLTDELKKRAKLKRNTPARPQSASFDLSLDKKSLGVEISVMPVLGGEKIVMHLSPEDGDTNNLEDLGFWGEGLSTVRRTLAGSSGLILVSGHRRDGITDTLDGLRDLLDSPIAKIARIKSDGASLADLEKALDEDSNIIAVDRLNDKHTATLAADSALKRRMILAGIYAEGAIDALGHLRSLGVESFVLASVTRLSIGQRRLRQLCQSCAERYELDFDERKKLEKDFNLTPALNRKIYELEKSAQKAGMGSLPLNSTGNRITHVWRPNKNGCSQCDDGYSNYTAAVEVLPITDTLQKLLANDKIPARQELQKVAEGENFVPMALDGLIKSLRGQTTTEEVLRACRP